MITETPRRRLARAFKLQAELRSIATSFAVGRYSNVAVSLNRGCDQIDVAKRNMDTIEASMMAREEFPVIKENIKADENPDRDNPEARSKPNPCECGSTLLRLIQVCGPQFEGHGAGLHQIYPPRVAIQCPTCGTIGQDTCHGGLHAIRRWNWHGGIDLAGELAEQQNTETKT